MVTEGVEVPISVVGYDKSGNALVAMRRVDGALEGVSKTADKTSAELKQMAAEHQRAAQATNEHDAALDGLRARIRANIERLEIKKKALSDNAAGSRAAAAASGAQSGALDVLKQRLGVTTLSTKALSVALGGLVVGAVLTFFANLVQSMAAAKAQHEANARAVYEHRTQVAGLVRALEDLEGREAFAGVKQSQERARAFADEADALLELQRIIRAQNVGRRASEVIDVPVELADRLRDVGELTTALGDKTLSSLRGTHGELAELMRTAGALGQRRLEDAANVSRAGAELAAQQANQSTFRLGAIDDEIKGLQDRLVLGEENETVEARINELLQERKRISDDLESRTTLPDVQGGRAPRTTSVRRPRVDDPGPSPEDLRRQAVDFEHALTEARLEAMADGIPKVEGMVELAFARRREALVRSFGPLSSEMLDLLRQLEERATAQARQSAFAIGEAFDIEKVLDEAMGKVVDLDDIKLPEIKPPPMDFDTLEGDFERGVYTSIASVELALRELEGLKLRADTQEARDEIQALIEKLEELGVSMEGVKAEGFDLSGALQDAFSEITRGIGVLEGIYADTAQRAGDAYADAVEKQTDLLVSRGMAEEQARAQAEATNVALLDQQRKALEASKNAARAQVAISAALGIMSAWEKGPIYGAIMTPLVLATAALQLKAINSETLPGGSGASASSGSGDGEREDVQSTIIVGRPRGATGRNGRGTASTVLPAGSPILPPAAGIASPSAAPQNVNVSSTVALQGRVIEVKTRLQDLRIELQREDDRQSYLTGGRE